MERFINLEYHHIVMSRKYGRAVYLIERIWVDSMAPIHSPAVGYSPLGYAPDEDTAKNFCAGGRKYTHENCPTLLEGTSPKPEYRYSLLEQVNKRTRPITRSNSQNS